MSGEWNFMTYDSKDNVLRTVVEQSDQMLSLAGAAGAWGQPTAAGHWRVGDVIGHLVDTTEEYFLSFDAARGKGSAKDPLGLADMSKHVDEGALSFQAVAQGELIERLRGDRQRMVGILGDLSADDWGGLMVPHKYMGPLPAFFYPVFQLVDYAVHNWDIRQGSGRAHALDGDSADLLAPVCFVLWQATANCSGVEPFTFGVRVSGRNGGDTVVKVGPEGLAAEPGNIDGLPAIIEFDPASFVLTTFGRINGGTARGDQRAVERFCNLFFRI